MGLSFAFEYPDPDEVMHLLVGAENNEWFIGDNKPTIPGSEDELGLMQWLREDMVKREQAGLPLVVVRLNQKPIGFSLYKGVVKGLAAEEAHVNESDGYYKLGTFFIDEKYRGKGYGYETAKWFLKQKKKMVYTMEHGNYASEAIAIKIGLRYSHDFWYCRKSQHVWFEDGSHAKVKSVSRNRCYKN